MATDKRIKKYQVKKEIRYGFHAYLGTNSYGKEVKVAKRGFTSYRDAKVALARLENDFKREKKKKVRILTFGEAYLLWIKEYEREVKDSTLLKTTRIFRNHILKKFEKTPLPNMTKAAIKEFSDELLENMASESVRKIIRFITSVFHYLNRYDYFDGDPTQYIKIPTKRNNDLKQKFWEKDDLQYFFTLVEKEGNLKKHLLFRLLAFTGIRKGECLALTWSDFNGNTLSINKALARAEYGLFISEPKTRSSKRLISLDQKTLEIYQAFKKTYQPLQKGDFLFQNEEGYFLGTDTPRKWLHALIKDTPLVPISIHGFRHTHASLLFESGLDLKQVQSRLGHSDLQTTMNVYTHVTTKAKDEIGERFASYMDF